MLSITCVEKPVVDFGCHSSSALFLFKAGSPIVFELDVQIMRAVQ